MAHNRCQDMPPLAGRLRTGDVIPRPCPGRHPGPIAPMMIRVRPTLSRRAPSITRRRTRPSVWC